MFRYVLAAVVVIVTKRRRQCGTGQCGAAVALLFPGNSSFPKHSNMVSMPCFMFRHAFVIVSVAGN
jgi:hypothetical protein